MGRIKDLTNTNAASTSDRFAIDDGASVRSITFDKLANQIIDSYGSRLFSLGTDIPSNADLNNYTVPGVYTCVSSTVAATLSNSPTTYSGFKLEVKTTANLSRYIQVAYCNYDDGAIFVRGYTTDGWGSWERLARASEVAYNYTPVSLTLGSVTQSFALKKFGRVAVMQVNLGSTSGTPFSGIENNPTIGTIPEGFRPNGTQQVFAAGQARTSGAWATANYFPIVCGIQTDGTIKIYGNTNNLKTCQFVTFSVTYITD